jgi:DNA-binding transcriptional LysR family regulator
MHRNPPRERLVWDDVRLFLALSRARTVGAAGRALGVDGSTVSRRLAVLEKSLGATLFDRGRNGIAPTESAEALLPVAERIEEAMSSFSNAADALEHEVSGLVRITCPSDVAEVVLVPLLPELFRKHPRLHVDLDAGEVLRDLSRREADIALRVVRPDRGDLIVMRLLSVRWVLAATPALAKQLGKLGAWSAAPWIGFGERLTGSPPARWYEEFVGRDADPRLRSDNLQLQLAALRRGAGVALVPEPSVEAYGLVRVELSRALGRDAAHWPVSELHLVTHRVLRDVPRVRAVWELLVDRLGERGRRRAKRAAT